MFKRFSSAVIAALLLCTASAQAADYKLTFTASGFGWPGVPAPQNVVTGSFIYSANMGSGLWAELKAVDLTIDGHVYTLAEIKADLFFGKPVIGVPVSGVAGVTQLTDDFYFFPVDHYFVYAASNRAYVWSTSDVTVFTTQISAVPEPETYAMLLAGLGLMGFAARRRKA